MGVAERKGRERAERERRITAAARLIAAREGWSAVTIRRLAEEIEYSQPVLYAHFENRNAIVAAVAVEGFRELTTALREAAHPSADRRAALCNVSTAYLGFACEHRALYEAVVTPAGKDDEVATETFWSALHGLAELERAGRIRRGARDKRTALLVDRLFMVE